MKNHLPNIQSISLNSNNNNNEHPEINTPNPPGSNDSNYEASTPFYQYDNTGINYFDTPDYLIQNDSNYHRNSLLENSQSLNTSQYNTSHSSNQQSFYCNIENNTYSNDNIYFEDNVNDPLSEESHSSPLNEGNDCNLHENNLYIHQNQHNLFFERNLYNQQDNSYNINSNNTNDNNLLSPNSNFLNQGNFNMIEKNIPNINRNIEEQVFDDIPNHSNFYEQNVNISNDVHNIHMYPDTSYNTGINNYKHNNMFQVPESRIIQNINQNKNNISTSTNYYNTLSNYNSNNSMAPIEDQHNNQIFEKDIHIKQVLNNNRRVIPSVNPILQQKSNLQYRFKQNVPSSTNSLQYYMNDHNSFQPNQANVNYSQKQQYHQQEQNNLEKINNTPNFKNNFHQQQSSQQQNFNNLSQPFVNYKDSNVLHSNQLNNSKTINSKSLQIEIEKQRLQQNLLINQQNNKEKSFNFPSTSQQNIFPSNNKYFDQSYVNSNQLQFQNTTNQKSMNHNNYPIINQHDSQKIYNQDTNKINQQMTEVNSIQKLYPSSHLSQQTGENYHFQQYYSKNFLYNYPQGQVINNTDKSSINSNIQYNYKQRLNYPQQNLEVINQSYPSSSQTKILDQNLHGYPLPRDTSNQTSNINISNSNIEQPISKSLNPVNHIPYISTENIQQNKPVEKYNTPSRSSNNNNSNNNNNNNTLHYSSLDQCRYSQTSNNTNDFSSTMYQSDMVINSNEINQQTILTHKSKDTTELNFNLVDEENTLGISSEIIPPIRQKRQYTRRNQINKINDEKSNVDSSTTAKYNTSGRKGLQKEKNDTEVKIPKRRGRKPKILVDLESQKKSITNINEIPTSFTNIEIPETENAPDNIILPNLNQSLTEKYTIPLRKEYVNNTLVHTVELSKEKETLECGSNLPTIVLPIIQTVKCYFSTQQIIRTNLNRPSLSRQKKHTTDEVVKIDKLIEETIYEFENNQLNDALELGERINLNTILKDIGSKNLLNIEGKSQSSLSNSLIPKTCHSNLDNEGIPEYINYEFPVFYDTSDDSTYNNSTNQMNLNNNTANQNDYNENINLTSSENNYFEKNGVFQFDSSLSIQPPSSFFSNHMNNLSQRRKSSNFEILNSKGNSSKIYNKIRKNDISSKNLPENDTNIVINLETIQFANKLVDKINVTIQIDVTLDDIIHGIYVFFPYDLKKINTKNKPNMYALLSILIREILASLKFSNTGVILFNCDSFLIPYNNKNTNILRNKKESSFYTDIKFWDFNAIQNDKEMLISNKNYGLLLNVEENKNGFYLTFSRYPLIETCNKRNSPKDSLKSCLLKNFHQLEPHFFESIHYHMIITAIKKFFQKEIIEYLVFCNEKNNPVEALLKKYINYKDDERNQSIFLNENNVKDIELYKNFKLCGLFSIINNVPNIINFRKSGNFRQYCGNICKVKLFNSKILREYCELNGKKNGVTLKIEDYIKQLLIQNNLLDINKINIFKELCEKNYTPQYLNTLLWNLNKDNLSEENVTVSIELNSPRERIESSIKNINLFSIKKISSSFTILNLNLMKNMSKLCTDKTIKISNKWNDKLTIRNYDMKVVKKNNLSSQPYIVTKKFVNEKNTFNISNNMFNICRRNNSLSIAHVEKIKHYYNMDKLNVMNSNIDINNTFKDANISCIRMAKINDATGKLSVAICKKEIDIFKEEETIKVYGIGKAVSCDQTTLSLKSKQFTLSNIEEKFNVHHTKKIVNQHSTSSLCTIQSSAKLKNNLTEASISSIEIAKINDAQEAFSFAEKSGNFFRKSESIKCSTTIPEVSYSVKTAGSIYRNKINLLKQEDNIKTSKIFDDQTCEKTNFNVNNVNIFLSKRKEELKLLHIEEDKKQHITDSFHIIESKFDLKNNLTKDKMSSVEKCKVNDAEEHFSLTEINFELNKKNDIVECFNVLPEKTYVKTTTTICENKVNLFKKENLMEVYGIVKDKVGEKVTFNINNVNIVFSKRKEESTLLHVEEVKKQHISDNFHTVEVEFNLKNRLTKNKVSSIEKCKINDAKEQLSLTEINFESSKKNDIVECSSIIPEVKCVVKSTINICENKIDLSKKENFMETSGIAKDKACEKMSLKLNNLCVELNKPSINLKFDYIKEIGDCSKGYSFDVTKLNSSLVKKSVKSTADKIIVIPNFDSSSYYLKDYNVTLSNNYCTSTTSCKFKSLPEKVGDKFSEINSNFDIIRNEESFETDGVLKEKTSEVVKITINEKERNDFYNEDIDLTFIENEDFFEDNESDNTDTNDEMYVYENPSSWKRRRMSYQSEDMECNLKLNDKYLKKEDYQCFGIFMKLFIRFLEGYSIKDSKENNKELLETILIKIQKLFPNIFKNASIDSMEFIFYKFIKILNFPLHNDNPDTTVTNKLIQLLQNNYGNKLSHLESFLSHGGYNQCNLIEKNFNKFLKIIESLILNEKFQSLVTLVIQKENESTVNVEGGISDESTIVEKFKILYDALYKVDGIDKNEVSTKLFLYKMANKYIGKNGLNYKKLFNDISSSEDDFNYLQKKYPKFNNYFISFSVKKKQFLECYKKLNKKKNIFQKCLNLLIEYGTIIEQNNIDNGKENSYSKIDLKKYLSEKVNNTKDDVTDFLKVNLVRNNNDKSEIFVEVLNLSENIEKPSQPSKRGRKPGSKNVRKRKLANSLFIDLYNRYEKGVQDEISKKALEHSKKYTSIEECSDILKQIFSFDDNMKKLYKGRDDNPREILNEIANFNPLLYICATGIRFDELKLFENYNPLQCQMMEEDDTKCTFKASNKDALYYHILQFHHDSTKRCIWKGCHVKTCFKAISNFAEHIASHIKYKRFACIVCQNTYSRHADLKVHIRRNHSSRYRIKCPLKRCNHYFTTVEASIKHLHVYHFPIKQWVCPVYGCGKAFFDKGGTNQHIKTAHEYSIKKICKLLCCSEYKNTSFGVITNSLLNHFEDSMNENLFSQKHLNLYHCKDVCVHTKEKPIEVSNLTNCILKKDLHKIADFGFETFLNQLKKYDCFTYIRAIEDMKTRKQYEMLPILNKALNFYIDSSEELLHKNDVDVYGQMVVELNKPNSFLKIITLETNQKRFEIPEEIPKNVPELLKNFILNKSYICPNYLERVQKSYDLYVQTQQDPSNFDKYINTVPRFIDYKIPVQISSLIDIDDSLKLLENKENITNEDKMELEKYFWKKLLEGSISIMGLSYFKKGLLSISDDSIKVVKKLYSSACYKFALELKKNSGFSEEAEDFFLEQYQKIQKEFNEIEHEANIYLNFKNVLEEIYESIGDGDDSRSKLNISGEKIFAENDFMSSFEAFTELTKMSVSDIEQPRNKRKIKKNVGEGTTNIIDEDIENKKSIHNPIFNIDLPYNENSIFDESGVYSNLGYNIQLMCRAKISGIYGIHISEDENTPFEKKVLKYMINPFCCDDIMIPDEYKYETYDTKGYMAYIIKQKRVELVDTRIENPILNDILILDDETAKRTNQTNICLKAHVNPNDRRKIKLKNNEGLVIEVELSQLDYFRCRIVDTKENDLYRITKSGLKTITTVKPKITAMYGVQNWEFIGSSDE
uniref:C2H2-type domain-containing protein n=1 Tax=Strongyloides stercoralis TaxID=6248 RepID=A0A0K0DZR4_STRER